MSTASKIRPFFAKSQLPYSQDNGESKLTNEDLDRLTWDADVQALRDEAQADLVLMVGSFVGDVCGKG